MTRPRLTRLQEKDSSGGKNNKPSRLDPSTLAYPALGEEIEEEKIEQLLGAKIYAKASPLIRNLAREALELKKIVTNQKANIEAVIRNADKLKAPLVVSSITNGNRLVALTQGQYLLQLNHIFAQCIRCGLIPNAQAMRIDEEKARIGRSLEYSELPTGTAENASRTRALRAFDDLN